MGIPFSFFIFTADSPFLFSFGRAIPLFLFFFFQKGESLFSFVVFLKRRLPLSCFARRTIRPFPSFFSSATPKRGVALKKQKGQKDSSLLEKSTLKKNSPFKKEGTREPPFSKEEGKKGIALYRKKRKQGVALQKKKKRQIALKTKKESPF